VLQWSWGGLAFLVLVAAAGVTAWAQVPDVLSPDLDVRALPSLVVRWRCHCSPTSATVGPVPGGAAVFVMSPWRFFALDAATHDLLWDHKLDDATAPVGRPLLLEDRVALVYQDRVFLVEPASGVIVSEVEMQGRVEHAVGSPLTLALIRSGEGSWRSRQEVVRIDATTGQVVARRSLGVIDLAAEDGRLLVVPLAPTGEAAQAPSAAVFHHLVELSPEDLSTIASWPGVDAHFLHSSRDGRVLVPVGRTEDGWRYVFADELAQGGAESDGTERGAMPRTSSSGTFHDMDAELQAGNQSNALEPTPLRRVDQRTGEVLWTTVIPDQIGAWLWDGGRLLVHTRPFEGGRGLLLTLDPATGEVLEAAYGLAGVRSLTRWGDLLIAVTRDEVVAFAAETRGPPEAQVRPVAEEVDRLLARLAGRRAPWGDSQTTQELEALGPEALPLLAARLPELGPQAALTVVAVLADADYQLAAAVVADLLDSFPETPDDAPKEWTHRRPKTVIVRALGRIGGPDQVPAIGRFLLDPATSVRDQERAVLSLVEMGVPEVVPWVDRFYARSEAEAAAEAGTRHAADGGPARTSAASNNPGRRETPSHRPDRPPGEEDAIRLAIVRHVAAFDRLNGSHCLWVVTDRPMEIPALGPVTTIHTVRPGFPLDDRPDRCSLLSPAPATEEEAAEYPDQYPQPAPGDQLWVLHRRSGAFSSADWVVVRPVGDRWLVRDITSWWMS